MSMKPLVEDQMFAHGVQKSTNHIILTIKDTIRTKRREASTILRLFNAFFEFDESVRHANHYTLAHEGLVVPGNPDALTRTVLTR